MEDERRKVRFETVNAERIPFGRKNFLEIARMRAVTPEGENEYISLSRGYYLSDGSTKFKRSITVPDDAKIKEFIAEKIRAL